MIQDDEVSKISDGMIRCRHCREWYTMVRTGWRSQHRCTSCQNLSYLYREDEVNAAYYKGHPAHLPGEHEAVTRVRAMVRSHE